jgi:hypothetical protein
VGEVVPGDGVVAGGCVVVEIEGGCVLEGGTVAGCVVLDRAVEATLPACMVAGPSVGLIIVTGPDPIPPPTHPDMVIVPVVDVPGVWGASVGGACANAVADPATNTHTSDSRFMMNLLNPAWNCRP